MDRHVTDDEVGGLAAQERGHGRIDVLELKRLGPGFWPRISHVDGKNLRRGIVSQKENPSRPERNGSGGLDLHRTLLQPVRVHHSSFRPVRAGPSFSALQLQRTPFAPPFLVRAEERTEGWATSFVASVSLPSAGDLCSRPGRPWS